MTPCQNCGRSIPDDAQFCPSCGTKIQPTATQRPGTAEQVLGTVLFGGYYKDICFTDRRVIQFEIMRDRYKFLAKALGPKPLVVEKGGKISDVLPFVKTEVPRNQIASIDVKNHGRFGRGHITILRTSGSPLELARIDVDVDKEAFGELAELVRGVYPEIKTTVA
ncbi:MAG: zinc ribbon domain-containing protein [Thaumarchaeota archaeon]|nr:zinc ribbon domain-containing protein [Nitrososphaerota archaeon]